MAKGKKPKDKQEAAADEEGKSRKPRFKKPTPIQTAVFGGTTIFVSWVATVSALLASLAAHYSGQVVDVTRERYALAAAERVRADAKQVFDGAYGARQAVDYAVQRQLYFEPLDYDALRMALEPAFAAFPALRAVDIAFDARNDSLTIRRQLGSGAKTELLVQSDAIDCFEKLGRLGCLSARPGREMKWFAIGVGLPGGSEADDESAISDQPLDSFQWAPGPGMVANEQGDIIELGTAVAWAPAHSLIFRSVFPGTSGKLSVIGRAVLEVTGLRVDDRLDDAEKLGQSGGVYICDNYGSLLATLLPGKQALIQSPSGVTRFRLASELGGWSSDVSMALLAQARKDGSVSFKVEELDMHVAVMPMTGRGNGEFFVVVGADRTAFVDDVMQMICSSAVFVIMSPYPAGALIGLICGIIFLLAKRRRRKRVHAEQDDKAKPGVEKALQLLRHRTGGQSSGAPLALADNKNNQLALRN